MEPVKLWYFHEAPKEYQDLSENGGDEDHLAFVPKEQLSNWQWMEDRLGFSHTCVVILPSGDRLYIGCHS